MMTVRLIFGMKASIILELIFKPKDLVDFLLKVWIDSSQGMEVFTFFLF